MPKINRTLRLQRIALKAQLGSGPPEVDYAKITDRRVKAGCLEGDTLALFVWREVRDAHGDPASACEMIDRAIRELQKVYHAMEAQIK